MNNNEPWVIRWLPLTIAVIGAIVWLVRLEGKIEHHDKLPYHDGAKSAYDDLIAIKVELRYFREELGEIKRFMEKLRDAQ